MHGKKNVKIPVDTSFHARPATFTLQIASNNLISDSHACFTSNQIISLVLAAVWEPRSLDLKNRSNASRLVDGYRYKKPFAFTGFRTKPGLLGWNFYQQFTSSMLLFDHLLRGLIHATGDASVTVGYMKDPL